MDTRVATTPTLLGPINQDWTIADLLQRLADDSWHADEALRHPLTLIEAALTADSWAAVPSTTALIRSIALASRADSRLLDAPIRDVLAAPATDRDEHLASPASVGRDLADRDTPPIRLDEVGASFTDEHDCDVRVDGHDLGHHRGIRHPQPGHALHTQLRIQRG